MPALWRLSSAEPHALCGGLRVREMRRIASRVANGRARRRSLLAGWAGDAVGGLANPATYPGCAATAGHLAERHAREKNADHPVFDAQTRRRMHTFDFFFSFFSRAFLCLVF